jgi:hypothetical protein
MTIEELAKLSDEELRVMCAQIHLKMDLKQGNYMPVQNPSGTRGYRDCDLSGLWIYRNAERAIGRNWETPEALFEGNVKEYARSNAYTTDLNAMHEVIATLTDEELGKVACLLRRMSANDPDDPEATLWDAHGWPGLLKASPRQIGIAFIAVKQQPVEVKGGGE